MIIPHYEIIINHHHFIQELLTPTPTQALQALTKLSPVWTGQVGYGCKVQVWTFPKFRAVPTWVSHPAQWKGQRFLISSWGSKLQIHPAQPFLSFLLVQIGKLRHSKGNWGLQEIASKGALSFHEDQSTWLSYLCFLYKDGADLQGLPPWG